ncbi:hypothetical protein JX266_013142 [Neoarthrinium moseri]|uniref:uncharacterized protein n=1 Tax=Neoarthrinium moseri TaxID=1658444 RepID=UPI001FDE79D5|nr:uncharacterized protein JN550_004324 [Neoarthrinium moseri]KAI1840680.1 hypothetical protein JX266_013142 [Neoarthrinium moseri]KAI1872121.1 hypothetical protein JN550_004324 [Neoarthrinium moseri]
MGADAQSAINEIFILLGLGLGVILLRSYARWQAVGFRRWEADDYLMIVAMGVYTAESVLASHVVTQYDGLANNGMTDDERATLDPDSDEYRKRVGGSKTQVPGWVMYVLLLWIIKAALCTMFLRLTERLGTYRRRIFIGFGLISVTWLVVTLCILFGCTPMEKNWQINPNPGLNCQPASSRINVFVTLALNVATDIYLLTIPVPMLWSANIKLWKKLGLIVLFSGGIFVMMAGILRCVLILANDVTGAQDGSAWAVRETFVAVVTSNVPLIFPLIRTWLGSWVGSFSSRKESRSGRTGVPHGSIPLPDRSWKGREEAYSSPSNAFAFTGSRERIIDPPSRGIKVEMNVEVNRDKTVGKDRPDSDSDF